MNGKSAKNIKKYWRNWREWKTNEKKVENTPKNEHKQHIIGNLKWNVWIFVNKGRWMNYMLVYHYYISLIHLSLSLARSLHVNSALARSVFFINGLKATYTELTLFLVDFVIKINTYSVRMTYTHFLIFFLFVRSFQCFNILSNRFFIGHIRKANNVSGEWTTESDDESCAGISSLSPFTNT